MGRRRIKKNKLYISDRGHDPQKNNYYSEVMKLASEAAPGKVVDVHIEHDDWCTIWSGGICNCNPNVHL